MKLNTSTIITGLLLVILGLGTIWWLHNFDRIEESRYKGLSGEARKDPFLAMKRLLEKMNVKVEERTADASSSAKFSGWPAGGTVILGDRRHVVMTKARVDETLAWVQAGGHLIVEAEFPRRPDPLLAALNIERRPQPMRAPRNGPPGGSAGSPKDVPAKDRSALWNEANLTEVSIPGQPRVLKAQFSPYQSLADPKGVAQWKVENAQGVRLIHLARGTGQVTVVSNFDWMVFRGTFGVKNSRDNRGATHLGKFDHADLLLALIRLNPDYAKTPLRLIWGDDDVSTWQIFAAQAWMALVAFGVLVAVWLARVIPRFGPLRPEPAPAEQRLAAHLEASGRFMWKYLAPHVVYARIRDAFTKRLAERRPALTTMPAAERNTELARLISVRAEAVARALDMPVQTASEFVRNVRLLQRLLEKI
jgi:hypothetical protein